MTGRHVIRYSADGYHSLPVDDITDDSSPDIELLNSDDDRSCDLHINQLIISDQVSDDDGVTERRLQCQSSTNSTNRRFLSRWIPRNVRLPNLSNLSEKQSCICGLLVSIFLLLSIPCVCFSLGYYSVFIKQPRPVIDKSYHAFSIPNHPASMNYAAYKVAVEKNASRTNEFYYVFATLNMNKHRYRRDVSDQRTKLQFQSKDNENKRLFPNALNDKDNEWKMSEDDLFRSKYDDNLEPRKDIVKRSSDMFTLSYFQSHIQWKLEVVFLVKGDDDNVFTRKRLEQIHDIEQKIVKYPQFEDFCYRDLNLIHTDPVVQANNGCAPLNSLMTYFYPSQVGNKTYFDGLGSELMDINDTIKLALTSEHFYYFVDEKMNRTNLKSSLLRTEVLFGVPLKSIDGSAYTREEKKDLESGIYKNFIIKYIDLLSKASTDELQVLYGGNEIFDFEVESTFWNDIVMAWYAAGAIFLFMLIFTSFSIWLTLFGLVAIVSCFPLAFFFYRIVFGIRALGILNGVAAFLIIGIGVDDIFVFINIFRQSSNIQCRRKRLWYTIRVAGKATFFTSFTTAAAFAANMTSSIPAVHQFGLFMSLIVACCWITVLLILPPALYIWSYSFAHCEKAIAKLLCRCCKTGAMYSLPKDIATFVQGYQTDEAGHQATTSVNAGIHVPDVQNDEEDDLPLLMLDDPMEYYISTYGDQGDDEPLLIPTTVPQVAAPSGNCGDEDAYIGGLMQSFVYHFIAKPAVKARWVILVISMIVLAVTIGLATQLQTASKPPQIFREDTNLQMLLDLKAKLGIDSLSCYKCSAVYNLDSSNAPSSFPTEPQIPNLDKTFFPSTIPLPPTTFSQKHVPPMLKPTTVDPKAKWKTSRKMEQKKSTLPTAIPGDKITPKPTPKPTPKLTPKPTPEATNKPTPKPTVSVQGRTTKEPERVHTKVAPKTVSTHAPAPTSKVKTKHLCEIQDCSNPKDRPMIETGASVYVVFGIKSLIKSKENEGHVMDDDMGKVEFDPGFRKLFTFQNNTHNIMRGLAKLCKICTMIASRTDLVRNGTAQCLPPYLPSSFHTDKIPECRELPKMTLTVYNKAPSAHYVGGMDSSHKSLQWWAFAFESTSSESQSYFSAYTQYLEWEKLIESIKDTELQGVPELQSVFQTSEFWTKVLMEVVAVSSAIYGLVLSMAICVIAVAIFTGHAVLLFIIFFTILEIIMVVVAIFYFVGWEMGGVEAVSLSILVGSSVDYCVHLVEGYLLAGRSIPEGSKETTSKSRQWRTRAALSHIGVSILSSALTTVIAAVPLTQTIIQPFSKFGKIVAVNTSVSIFYTLTVCSAFLASVAPAVFVMNLKSTAKAAAGTIVTVGLIVLCMFIVSKCGVFIPGPNGDALFGD